MSQRNRTIEKHAAAIPLLLGHILAASDLSLADLLRVLAVHLEGRSLDTIKRQWIRWAQGQTVPTIKQLDAIVRAARSRGWLSAPSKEVSVDVKALLDAIAGEAAKLRNADEERARVAMTPEAIRIAARIERMARDSEMPLDVALPAAVREVIDLFSDRMRAALGPGASPTARSLAASLGAGFGESMMRLAEELEAEEAALIRETNSPGYRLPWLTLRVRARGRRQFKD